LFHGALALQTRLIYGRSSGNWKPGGLSIKAEAMMGFVGKDRAWRIAEEWALKADDAADHEIGELFVRLRDKWIDIANKCELVDPVPWLEPEHSRKQLQDEPSLFEGQTHCRPDTAQFFPQQPNEGNSRA
jgi:hypothetical protein